MASAKQKKAQARFRKAAKSCKRSAKRKGGYRACMKKHLKKGRH